MCIFSLICDPTPTSSTNDRGQGFDPLIFIQASGMQSIVGRSNDQSPDPFGTPHTPAVPAPSRSARVSEARDMDIALGTDLRSSEGITDVAPPTLSAVHSRPSGLEGPSNPWSHRPAACLRPPGCHRLTARISSLPHLFTSGRTVACVRSMAV